MEDNSRKHHKMFKTPKRYRLSLYNENSLNRVWTFTMGRKRLLLLIVIIVLAIFSMGMMIVSFTPIRTLLPGYLRTEERTEVLSASSRIDSLAAAAAARSAYIDNISDILEGKINPDSLLSTSTESVEPDTASLMQKSPEEIEFVRMYSEREGFVLNDEQPVLAEAPAFVPPINGARVIADDNPASPQIMVLEEKNGIFAIGRGTVVEKYNAPDGSFVVLIQHPDGYLSRYTGLTRVSPKVGAVLVQGARIGTYDRNAAVPFKFELYRDGVALHPLDYIPF